MSNPARQPYLTESVHFQAPGVCRAAMITEVHVGATAAVAVFTPTEITLHQVLVHDEQRTHGTWHWAH